MNYSKLSVCIVLLAAVVFQACQKEETILETSLLPDASFRVSDYYDQINYNGVMLEFATMDVVKAVLLEMESDIDIYSDDFLAMHEGLDDDDDLNTAMDEAGFDEDQPLIDFENHFGFYSIRKILMEAEDSWLDAGGFDEENDPDNHFIVDHKVRTILNEFGEVNIEGTIYSFTEDGYTEFSGGGVERFMEMRNNDLEINEEGIVYHRGSGASCSSWKWSHGFATSGSRRIKWVIAHRIWPWGFRGLTKTKNYRLEGGKWKKFSTTTLVRTNGFVSNLGGNCDGQIDINPSDWAKVKIRRSLVQNLPTATKTQCNWMVGNHFGAQGVAFNSTLTW